MTSDPRGGDVRAPSAIDGSNAGVRPNVRDAASATFPDPAFGNGRDDGRTNGSDAASADSRPLTPDTLGIRPHKCFACGELNASGLRLPLHLEPGRCWTEIALPDRFEGWEGVVHGGILSTILDEVMGWALMEQDSWGVTGRLSVTFKAPVAPGQPIRAEGWVSEAKRRLQHTAGRIVDVATGRELVTAEALYVSASEDRKRALRERYGLLLSGRRDGGEADRG